MIEKLKKSRLLVKLSLLYISLLFAAYFLLCLAYSLPTGNMYKHVKESKEIFEVEGAYPVIMRGHYNTLLKSALGLPEDLSVNLDSKLDNFTDGLMLLEASFHSSHSPFIAAILNEHAFIKDNDPVETLITIHSDENTEFEAATYARYWHGYEIFLKPLLMMFNYQEIRYIIMAVQIILLITVITLLAYKHMIKEIVPFACMYLFLNPIALSLSLQFSMMFIIVLMQFIVFLLWESKYKYGRNLWIYHFFIIGCLTSYMDFLTYPFVTFGITGGYLIFRYCKTLKDSLVSFVKSGIAWSLGYILMWGGKWIGGSILSGTNIVRDALLTIQGRTSYTGADGAITYFDVLAKNIYVKFDYLFYATVFLIICVIIALFYKIKFPKKYIIFLIFAVLPCIWYLITANHSYVHAYFTYRELAVSVYALCSLAVMCLSEVRAQVKNKIG